MTDQAVHESCARSISSTDIEKGVVNITSFIVHIPDVESFMLEGREVMQARVEEGVEILRVIRARNE